MAASWAWCAAFVFALGAVVGSFLNVVIHRLPRNESIVFPGSRCPSCSTPIPGWANVPILAWIALRGRCRTCRAPISLRYPTVEALTGALFLGLWWVEPTPFAHVVAQWCVAAALVAVAFIDWEFKIVPNAITYPAIPLALALAFVLPPPDYAGSLPFWANALLGCVVGGGLMLGVSALYEWRHKQIGLGLGDVKLIVMLGAYLGLDAIFGVLLLGSLLGIVQWIGLRLFGRAGRRTRIAFAPALAVAGIVHQFDASVIGRWLAL